MPTVEKKKEARETHVTVRLSLLERSLLDDAAERSGLMTGSYVRSRLFDGFIPRQVRRPPIERKELARLLGELGKIGSNLNQLAKASNSGLVIYQGEIDAGCRALLEMRNAVLHALGREP